MRHRIVNEHIMGIPPGQRVHLEQLPFSAAGLRQLEAIHHSGKKFAVPCNLCFKRSRAKRTFLTIQQTLQCQSPFLALLQLHNHK
ncbi:hypothetical protein D3C87_1923960 [compost metagenome]